MASSRELIRQLQARGLTQRAIAQSVGRSPSMISKIATGAKPGANLTGALETIARGATPAVPPPDPRNPRAAQRDAEGRTRGFRRYDTPSGPVADASPSSMRALQRHLAGRGADPVAIQLRFVDTATGEIREVTMFGGGEPGKGGISPDTILRRWRTYAGVPLDQLDHDDALDAFIDWLDDDGNYSLVGAGAFLGVSISPFGG